MLERYIDQVIKKYGISNYELIHKCVRESEFPVILHNDIIVVHQVVACISKSQSQDASIQTIIRLESPIRSIDYNKNIFEVSEIDSTGVQLKSNLISHHNTQLNYFKPVPVNIYWGHVQYYLIKNHDA